MKSVMECGAVAAGTTDSYGYLYAPFTKGEDLIAKIYAQTQRRVGWIDLDFKIEDNPSKEYSFIINGKLQTVYINDEIHTTFANVYSCIPLDTINDPICIHYQIV